jgi:hypothetical protein
MIHTLDIKYHRSLPHGTGFRATCSCGAKIHRASGCNNGGLCYALSAAWDAYVRHCRKTGAHPVMHEDCKGLAGVGT